MYGAIRPYKGIDTALKAFAEVVKGTSRMPAVDCGKTLGELGSI